MLARFACVRTAVGPVVLRRSARRGLSPESNMLDWLTWPADQLLRVGGVVAGWFFSKDATGFTLVQMMFATVVLAAFVTLLVFSQRLLEYYRSLWKPINPRDL
jgi:hypothetical protein